CSSARPTRSWAASRPRSASPPIAAATPPPRSSSVPTAASTPPSTPVATASSSRPNSRATNGSSPESGRQARPHLIEQGQQTGARFGHRRPLIAVEHLAVLGHEVDEEARDVEPVERIGGEACGRQPHV